MPEERGLPGRRQEPSDVADPAHHPGAAPPSTAVLVREAPPLCCSATESPPAWPPLLPCAPTSCPAALPTAFPDPLLRPLREHCAVRPGHSGGTVHRGPRQASHGNKRSRHRSSGSLRGPFPQIQAGPPGRGSGGSLAEAGPGTWGSTVRTRAHSRSQTPTLGRAELGSFLKACERVDWLEGGGIPERED